MMPGPLSGDEHWQTQKPPAGRTVRTLQSREVSGVSSQPYTETLAPLRHSLLPSEEAVA